METELITWRILMIISWWSHTSDVARGSHGCFPYQPFDAKLWGNPLPTTPPAMCQTEWPPNLTRRLRSFRWFSSKYDYHSYHICHTFVPYIRSIHSPSLLLQLLMFGYRTFNRWWPIGVPPCWFLFVPKKGESFRIGRAAGWDSHRGAEKTGKLMHWGSFRWRKQWWRRWLLLVIV